MDEMQKKLEELEARIAVLERRSEGRATMKATRQCPACGGTKLVRTEHVRADIQAGVPLALSATVPMFGRVKPRGIFDVHACTDCGLVEWHALGLDERILEDSKIERVEPPEEEEEPGPYR